MLTCRAMRRYAVGIGLIALLAAGTGGNHPGHWVAKQVEFLENLN